MRAVITYLRRLIGLPTWSFHAGLRPAGPGKRLLAVIARIAYIVAEVALLAAPSL